MCLQLSELKWAKTYTSSSEMANFHQGVADLGGTSWPVACDRFISGGPGGVCHTWLGRWNCSCQMSRAERQERGATQSPWVSPLITSDHHSPPLLTTQSMTCMCFWEQRCCHNKLQHSLGEHPDCSADLFRGFKCFIPEGRTELKEKLFSPTGGTTRWHSCTVKNNKLLNPLDLSCFSSAFV